MESRAFGVAVRDLLIERGYVTAMGNPNWSAFALELPTIHYETLRKAVTGERAPARKVMAEIAEALGVNPSVFVEYALIEAQEAFDPTVVGQQQALANLAAWVEAQPRKRPARKKSGRAATA